MAPDGSGSSLAKTAFMDALREAKSRLNHTDPEEEPAVSNDMSFSHMIIGTSSRTKNDDLDHINFFKVIELNNGTMYMFEYALDAIQTSLGPRQRG